MNKVSSLVKLSVAFVFCLAIVNCGNKTTAQSSEAAKTETAETEAAKTETATAKIDMDDFVVSGNPDQLLEIDKAFLEYAKSAHINNEDDVKDFVKTMAEVKEMMTAVSDTINAHIASMTPEEKGDLVAHTTTISEQIEKNNDMLMKEIERLEKEAKKHGLTLPLDL